MTTTQTHRKSAEPAGASPAQLKCIRDLIVSRSQALTRRNITITEAQLLRLSVRGASLTIDKLRQLAADPKPAAKTVATAWPARRVHPGITPGVYAIDGKICKVIPSQQSSQQLYYVATLQSAPAGQSSSFISRGQLHLLYTLTPAHRLTAKQAAEYGAVFGRCCCCGKLLTVPLSVERGVGPICWEKYVA